MLTHTENIGNLLVHFIECVNRRYDSLANLWTDTKPQIQRMHCEWGDSRKCRPIYKGRGIALNHRFNATPFLREHIVCIFVKKMDGIFSTFFPFCQSLAI